MMNAPARLRSFRRQKGLTLRQLGDLLGVHLTMVSQIERGQRTPGLALAAKIETVTGGYIPPRDWVTTSEAA